MGIRALKKIGSLLSGGDKKKSDDEEDDSLKLDSEGEKSWNVGDHAKVHLDGIGEVVVPRGDMSEREWNNFIAEASKKQKLSNETVKETVGDRDKRSNGASPFEDRPKSDFMEVSVGRGRSETAVVPRGDMDESDWAALKNRAKKQGIFKASNDTVKAKIDNAESVQSTPALEKRRGQMAESTGMDAAPDEEEQAAERRSELPREDVKDLEQGVGDTSGEGQGGAHGVKRFVQGGIAGATPESQAAVDKALGPVRAATDTLTGRRSKKQAPRGEVDIGEAKVGAAETGPSAGAKAAVDKALGPVRAAGDAALKSAAEPSFAENLGADLTEQFVGPQLAGSDVPAAIGRGIQEVGHTVLPRTIPGATQPPPGPMVPPPAPGAAAPPPDVTGLPPQSPGQPPAPGGLQSTRSSLSMSSKTGAPAPDISMPDRSADIETAFNNAAQAHRASAELEAQGAKQRATEFDNGLKEQMRRDAKMADMRDLARKEREAPLKVYAKFLAEAQQPTTKVDPDRWYNSRNAGQKVLQALAWLFTRGKSASGYQHAVDADIEAQKADVSNEQNRKQMGMTGALNLYHSFRQEGLDEVQAETLAKVSAWDLVVRRGEMIRANTDSGVLKQKAEEAIADANVQKNQLLTTMDKYSADVAIRKAHLANETEEVNIKRQRANGPAKPRKLETLKGPQVDKIAALQTAVAKTAELEASFKGVSGLGSKVSKLAPGSKASRFDFDAEMNIANIADSLGNAGILQPGEVERYKKIHPQSGDIDGAYRLRSLRTDLQRRLDLELKAFKAAGFNMEDLTAASQQQQGPSSFAPDEEE